jgi:hypothetical protein
MEDILFNVVTTTGVLGLIVALWAINKDKERVLKVLLKIMYVNLAISSIMIVYNLIKTLF